VQRKHLMTDPYRKGGLVDVIAIDHLPTLLPRESSDRFCNDLLPSYLELKNFDSSRVWQEALKLFQDKIKESQN